ncbi:hypothetical protein CXG81DRAFT_26076 [Caulochytrium protostelioides]|uniref:Uncharacterized protein n=1 Tax=Caulochytrium protostelioides TaxID=1555241 RepID=A0A4P9X7K6_9FUNG|nr:hypothetical protein CXG81DRAFT_26076 [Caulochytrium protostelioides]|eukprot:RKP01215.1 hypothetical protein CXG81DRAFT_26076 [Caulochytrium protostelioides]
MPTMPLMLGSRASDGAAPLAPGSRLDPLASESSIEHASSLDWSNIDLGQGFYSTGASSDPSHVAFSPADDASPPLAAAAMGSHSGLAMRSQGRSPPSRTRSPPSPPPPPPQPTPMPRPILASTELTPPPPPLHPTATPRGAPDDDDDDDDDGDIDADDENEPRRTRPAPAPTPHPLAARPEGEALWPPVPPPPRAATPSAGAPQPAPAPRPMPAPTMPTPALRGTRRPRLRAVDPHLRDRLAAERALRQRSSGPSPGPPRADAGLPAPRPPLPPSMQPFAQPFEHSSRHLRAQFGAAKAAAFDPAQAMARVVAESPETLRGVARHVARTALNGPARRCADDAHADDDASVAPSTAPSSTAAAAAALLRFRRAKKSTNPALLDQPHLQPSAAGYPIPSVLPAASPLPPRPGPWTMPRATGIAGRDASAAPPAGRWILPMPSASLPIGLALADALHYLDTTCEAPYRADLGLLPPWPAER